MSNPEVLSLMLSIISISLALIFTMAAFIRRQRTVNRAKTAKSAKAVKPEARSKADLTATAFIMLALVFDSLVIISPAIEAGHGPFSNMYEFAVAFAWGIIIMGLIFRWRYKTGAVQNIGLIVALLLLIFARFKYESPSGLVPAIQLIVITVAGCQSVRVRGVCICIADSAYG